MRTKNLFFATCIFLTSLAHAQERTGSIGYRKADPMLTTNRTVSITTVLVNGKPTTETQTENISVISTEPVQKRTLCEKLFGLRPYEHRVVPAAAGSGGPNEYPNKRQPRIVWGGGYGSGYRGGYGGYGYTPMRTVQRNYSVGANLGAGGSFASGGYTLNWGK